MGAGSAWGSRDDFLHPRDSHGRFRNTWRMPRDAADAISKFLDSFSPKTFSSDADAQSWVHNESRKNRLGTNQGSAITNFVKGFSNVNANLRAGKTDPQAAQMLKGAEPLPNDLILSKTVEPSAFGLDPAHIANVEELTGKLIHDPGFTSANIGTPNPPIGPGPHIQMTIATPAGTKAIIPQVSSPTSEVVLTPDQNIRVTKVTSDGKGGYYMMAVATPGGTPKEKSTPLHEAPPAPAPLNLPPKPGEQATPGTAPAAPESPAPTPTPSAPSATQPPASPAGSPTATSAPRSEPNVVEALTPGGTPTPAAQPAATPSAPEAPVTPEVPAGPVDFRQAVKDANIPSPTEGPRRKQWNNAYLGVVSGKKHPDDALRELRADIEHNKGTLADDVKTNTDSGPLPNDIKAQEALANLIEEKFNLGKPKETPPVEPKAAPTRRGPKSISKEEMPNKAQIRREARAKTPALTAEETARRKEAEALGVKAGEQRAAKNAAADAEAKKISDPWLEKAGVKDSELTDLERTGVALMADGIARKKISRPEAARRLRQEGKPDSKLSRIADAITARPTKAAPVAEPQAPTPPATKALPESLTIPQLRQVAKERGIKIPAKITRKADIRAHLEGDGTPATAAKPTWEDRVAAHLLDKIRQNDPKVADEVLGNLSPADRRAVDEAVARVKGAESVTKIGPNEALPEKATIAQLRQIAKDRGVKIPSSVTRKDDIRRHIEGDTNLEQAANSRQQNINKARNIADIAGELDHLLDNDASPKALTSRVGTWSNKTSASRDVTDRLLKVVETNDKGKIDAELARLRKEAGLSVIGGKRGETVPFNPTHHEATSGGIKTGEPVLVSRTGHEATLPGGEKVRVGKAGVEPVGVGKGEIPKGSDITTAIGKLDPKVVKDRKAIIDGVRKDLAEGKRPAEVGRALERTARGIENSSVLRHGGHRGNESPERLAEIKKLRDADQHDADELKRLADHLKASRRAPEPKLSTETEPAKKAAPVAKKAVTKIQAPEELRQAVAKTSIADLRKQAADEGIKVPASARTKQQIVDHIAQEMAKRELARRGAAKAAEPRAAKAATPVQKQEVIDRMRAKAAPAKAAKKAESAVEGPSARSITSRRMAEQAQAQRVAQAERTGIQAGKFSDKPILENHWGEFGAGEIGFHPDGAIGKALRYMGEDRKLDVNGEPLANVVGKLATDGVRGRKTIQQVLDELKTLTERLPEGSAARRELDDAVKEMDAPKRTVSLPSGTPKPVVDLARKLEQIPLARRTHDRSGHEERITSELSLLAEIADKYSKGEMSGFRLIREVERLRNRKHESQEGKLQLDRAITDAVKELEAIGQRNLNPPPKKGD